MSVVPVAWVVVIVVGLAGSVAVGVGPTVSCCFVVVVIASPPVSCLVWSFVGCCTLGRSWP